MKPNKGCRKRECSSDRSTASSKDKITCTLYSSERIDGFQHSQCNELSTCTYSSFASSSSG